MRRGSFDGTTRGFWIDGRERRICLVVTRLENPSKVVSDGDRKLRSTAKRNQESFSFFFVVITWERRRRLGLQQTVDSSFFLFSLFFYALDLLARKFHFTLIRYQTMFVAQMIRTKCFVKKNKLPSVTVAHGKKFTNEMNNHWRDNCDW